MAERSFLDKIWKPDEDRMAGPVNLDAIGYVENRNLPGFTRALPGPDGELGKFQITPPMWKDLQRLMPEKYGKKFHWLTSVVDPWAEEAAADYLTQLQTHYAPHYNYAPTADNLVAGYNGGPKAPIRTNAKAVADRKDYQNKYSGALQKVR
jgi:hypothetical protein